MNEMVEFKRTLAKIVQRAIDCPGGVAVEQCARREGGVANWTDRGDLRVQGNWPGGDAHKWEYLIARGKLGEFLRRLKKERMSGPYSDIQDRLNGRIFGWRGPIKRARLPKSTRTRITAEAALKRLMETAGGTSVRAVGEQGWAWAGSAACLVRAAVPPGTRPSRNCRGERVIQELPRPVEHALPLPDGAEPMSLVNYFIQQEDNPSYAIPEAGLPLTAAMVLARKEGNQGWAIVALEGSDTPLIFRLELWGVIHLHFPDAVGFGQNPKPVEPMAGIQHFIDHDGTGDLVGVMCPTVDDSILTDWGETMGKEIAEAEAEAG